MNWKVPELMWLVIRLYHALLLLNRQLLRLNCHLLRLAQRSRSGGQHNFMFRVAASLSFGLLRLNHKMQNLAKQMRQFCQQGR